MLELIIERWTEPKTGTTFRWSLWQDGQRILMGGPHKSGETSENDGLRECEEQLGRAPDRVTRL
jgi:hypothetical protein